MSQREYELPKHLDRYLAALSKLYAQDGERQLQELVVNAQTRVHEEWTSDNWNGGTYGHALYLLVPESLFLNVVKQKEELQKRLCEDLNKVHNVQNEFIAEVFLELEAIDGEEWRQESGLLLAGQRSVSRDASKRIWNDGEFRVFLSHRAEVKRETSELKDQLHLFGISCFVAHEDIHPTKKWQDEIENALLSMDAFVPLMTKDFHESDWTDQEVGFAMARGVPIIAVKLGRDPYGFIGKFQALSTAWGKAALDIASIFIKQDRMVGAYIAALRRCRNFNDGNRLGELLPAIEGMSEQQVDDLVSAYNENDQLSGSFTFNGQKLRDFGPGLLPILNRSGKRKFHHVDFRKIAQT